MVEKEGTLHSSTSLIVAGTFDPIVLTDLNCGSWISALIICIQAKFGESDFLDVLKLHFAHRLLSDLQNLIGAKIELRLP